MCKCWSGSIWSIHISQRVTTEFTHSIHKIHHWLGKIPRVLLGLVSFILRAQRKRIKAKINKLQWLDFAQSIYSMLQSVALLPLVGTKQSMSEWVFWCIYIYIWETTSYTLWKDKRKWKQALLVAFNENTYHTVVTDNHDLQILHLLKYTARHLQNKKHQQLSGGGVFSFNSIFWRLWPWTLLQSY